jgi:hypothetical protein
MRFAGKHFVTALLLLAAGAAAAGAAAAGGEAGAGMGFGSGSRAAAMANAFAAVADDPTALFFNPAGLDQIPGGRVELTYHYPYAEIEDVAYASGVLSYNMSGRGFALGTFARRRGFWRPGGWG